MTSGNREVYSCSCLLYTESAVGTIECNTVLDEADRHLQSWSYWDTASGGVFWSGDEVNLEAVK